MNWFIDDLHLPASQKDRTVSEVLVYVCIHSHVKLKSVFVCGEDFIGFILALCRDLGLYSDQTYWSTCVRRYMHIYVCIGYRGREHFQQ